MCGIQIGRDELEAVLAHSAPSAASSVGGQLDCGIQVGETELAAILAHKAQAAAAPGATAQAECGVQAGAQDNLRSSGWQ